MKIYGYDWAMGVVTRWLESEPRVQACAQHWASLYRCRLGDEGMEILKTRLVWYLRHAKYSKTWNLLKKAPDNKLIWATIWLEYLKRLPKLHPEPIQVCSTNSVSIDLFEKTIKYDIDGERIPDEY